MTRFPQSRTRADLMRNFRAVFARIAQTGIRGEVWVDGSFLTEKIDPADVDCVLNIPPHFYESGTPEQTDLIEWLISSDNTPKRQFRCDIDVGIAYPEESPDHYVWQQVSGHWHRLFGFSVKTREPKGIAVLRVGEAGL